MKKEKAPHIMLTGGGTLGPVTPLLAVYDEWKKQNRGTQFSWIGTPMGPERQFLTSYTDISFYSLFAPKLSRHQKWKWIFLPILFLVSICWSWILLRKLKPDMIYTVGGYVSIPVFVVARMIGIPTWVHQLDVTPGIANKIMAKFATRVTTTFAQSAQELGALYVGGMVREMGGNIDHAYERFGLDPQKPTILVVGGGTGAMQINDAILAIKEDVLPLANIIHSFGRGKKPEQVTSEFGYHTAELLTDELGDAYAASELIIARGGLGTLLEAVFWRKPMIIIPIEGSHQEKNAKVIEEAAAGVVLTRMTPQVLLGAIQKIFERRLEREAMARNIGEFIALGAEETIVAESRQILGI